MRQDIAERPAISADYVAQLFRHLRKAELVKGIKGPGGGYRLIQGPATITAGHVLRAVEGPVAVVHCVKCPTRAQLLMTRGVALGSGYRQGPARMGLARAGLA